MSLWQNMEREAFIYYVCALLLLQRSSFFLAIEVVVELWKLRKNCTSFSNVANLSRNRFDKCMSRLTYAAVCCKCMRAPILKQQQIQSRITTSSRNWRIGLGVAAGVKHVHNGNETSARPLRHCSLARAAAARANAEPAGVAAAAGSDTVLQRDATFKFHLCRCSRALNDFRKAHTPVTCHAAACNTAVNDPATEK